MRYLWLILCVLLFPPARVRKESLSFGWGGEKTCYLPLSESGGLFFESSDHRLPTYKYSAWKQFWIPGSGFSVEPSICTLQLPPKMVIYVTRHVPYLSVCFMRGGTPSKWAAGGLTFQSISCEIKHVDIWLPNMHYFVQEWHLCGLAEWWYCFRSSLAAWAWHQPGGKLGTACVKDMCWVAFLCGNACDCAWKKYLFPVLHCNLFH